VLGDYRFICLIKYSELIMLVLKVGHRKDIYLNVKWRLYGKV